MRASKVRRLCAVLVALCGVGLAVAPVAAAAPTVSPTSATSPDSQVRPFDWWF